MKNTNLIRCVICLLAVAMMVGCGGGKRGKKVDYDSARTLPPLEIPPDLSSLPPDAQSSGTALPPGSATYSQFEEQQKERGTGPQVAGLLPQFENVRLVRAGGQRWLVVNAPAEQVWPQVPVFLDKAGLRIKKERPEAGIIETEWAENRAKVGSGVQKFFSKVTGQGYGTNLRDKYRIRLERGEQPSTTEIYLTHRGMEQFFVNQLTNVPNSEQFQAAVWQTRPPDPELEAEMLRRLMVHLGAGRSEADTIVAKVNDTPERARLSRNEKGYPALNLSDSLERAWRRVGLSLDRIGFTVEDRDRTTWTYHVRYIDPEVEANKKKKKKKKKKGASNSEEYQVALKAVDEGTDVEVLDNNGSPDPSNTSERILSLLYEQLK
jgi:outer membrane protein assembly factor BamC